MTRPKPAHTIRDHTAVLEAWLCALDPAVLAAVRPIVTPDTPADACIDYAFRLKVAIRTLRPVRGGDPGQPARRPVGPLNGPLRPSPPNPRPAWMARRLTL
ncbi:hypothetical protein GQ464_007430 [Rhodocaloribacter litoris]|uniref:hypothetical protein n=1 Tax=Rhodocaloribacter litoris TaxID=2558931 RepID=UPI0014226BC5|nr:hypothetical protein [Rhodocaloribacter litoris]QXD16760.1 hypothetical protein GQ464_007430 [Rhodocaloribacter litoris]